MQPERAVRPDRFLNMETTARYREFAEQCERLARQAKTERERAVLLEMAAVWRQLDDDAQRKSKT
jgi:hypothetical protein